MASIRVQLELTRTERDQLAQREKEAQTHIARLREALKLLSLEVGAVFGIAQEALREAIGNTNTQILMDRYADAKTALAETPAQSLEAIRAEERKACVDDLEDLLASVDDSPCAEETKPLEDKAARDALIEAIAVIMARGDVVKVAG